MRTLLAKSVRLNHYHTAIVITLVATMVWFILRYASMVQASLERTVFDNNVQLIHRLFQIRQILTHEGEDVCAAFDNPDLFQQASVGGLHTASLDDDNGLPLTWSYDPVAHVLTYHVRSSDYFRADPPQKIMLGFHCQRGKIDMVVSPHQWCREMAFWGCSQW